MNNNCSHCVNSFIQNISKSLYINLKSHCACHPASEGAVKQANQTLKTKLTEYMAKTDLSWVEFLLLALIYERLPT